MYITCGGEACRTMNRGNAKSPEFVECPNTSGIPEARELNIFGSLTWTYCNFACATVYVATKKGGTRRHCRIIERVSALLPLVASERTQ